MVSHGLLAAFMYCEKNAITRPSRTTAVRLGWKKRTGCGFMKMDAVGWRLYRLCPGFAAMSLVLLLELDYESWIEGRSVLGHEFFYNAWLIVFVYTEVFCLFRADERCGASKSGLCPQLKSDRTCVESSKVVPLLFTGEPHVWRYHMLILLFFPLPAKIIKWFGYWVIEIIIELFDPRTQNHLGAPPDHNKSLEHKYSLCYQSWRERCLLQCVALLRWWAMWRSQPGKRFEIVFESLCISGGCRKLVTTLK